MRNRILITGASSGIGEAAAYAFAQGRSRLFLVARRRERLRKIARICAEKGAPLAIGRAHDLSLPGEGKSIVQECLRELGGLDVLVCNAGYGLLGPIAEVSPQAMARVWQVNYQSAYESIHEALPYFLDQGRGHIALVSSIIGKKGMPFSGAYCATKFAQVGLGEALWGELKGTGVGVTIVCPGATATEFQPAAERPTGISTGKVHGQDPAKVASILVEAVLRRRREVHLTASGKFVLALDRVSPSLASHLMAWVGRKLRHGNARGSLKRKPREAS
ncbi:MAG: SDR family NAD(P)-dependent oxidoreductase [Acidobacteriota bacterium]